MDFSGEDLCTDAYIRAWRTGMSAPPAKAREITAKADKNVRPPDARSQGGKQVRSRFDLRPLLSLLLLLLPLPVDIKRPLFAANLHFTCPFERVPGDGELVLDHELVISSLPLGRESQVGVLQFHVLESLILLVRPVHRPGELVAVFRDRQCGRALPVADCVVE